MVIFSQMIFLEYYYFEKHSFRTFKSKSMSPNFLFYPGDLANPPGLSTLTKGFQAILFYYPLVFLVFWKLYLFLVSRLDPKQIICQYPVVATVTNYL